MKKAIAILLVLLVAGMAFGADLTLTTGVGAVAPQVKVSSGSAIANPGAFQLAVDISVPFSTTDIDIEATTLPSITDLFANVRTNSRSSFDVKISAEDMKNDDTSVTNSSIRYDVIAGTATIASTEAHVEEASATTLIAVDGTGITGMDVISQSFSITFLDSDTSALSIRNAVAGSYTGTVKFWVTAQ